MIDHHLYPEEFCKITMSYPKISSTSELIFRLICRMGYFSDISKEGAECIYTGMMTDTGGFTYNSNNREIYFIISELLSKGIDKDDIYRKVYNTYSESRLRLMGYVLSNMTVYSDYNAALITLTKAEQSKFNYIKGDSEGFVNIPLTIKNVCFSCFLREDTEKPMIKISLRSVGNFPCNQLAAEFSTEADISMPRAVSFSEQWRRPKLSLRKHWRNINLYSQQKAECGRLKVNIERLKDTNFQHSSFNF